MNVDPAVADFLAGERAAEEARAEAAAAAAAEPPPTVEPAPQAAAPAPSTGLHAQLAGFLVFSVDALAARWGGPHYRLDDGERAELTRLAGPALREVLPDLDDSELTPVQQFGAALVMVYGLKFATAPKPPAQLRVVPQEPTP